MAGAKLQDSNPGITNLSDDNRPTKVGEKFAELYDNEWTEAFEEHEETTGDEKVTIEYLYKLLLVSKMIIYEPRCEKTGLRVFRPGPTNPGCIAIDDRRLEISDLRSRGIVLTV